MCQETETYTSGGYTGCGLHDPRHHFQGGVLVHDRIVSRFTGLHQRCPRAEPRVRVSPSLAGTLVLAHMEEAWRI